MAAGPRRVLPWLVPGLFLVEALILAARIIPLWDVVDETGHFAYAREIWSGKGVLPLGEAQIDSDVMSHVLNQPSPAIPNAVAHHPPLYHVLAGAIWKGATFFTDDSNLLFRAPRLLSPIFGAVALLYIYKIVERLGLSPPTAFAVAAGFSAVPRFAWQSAGITHDILLAMFSAASAYYFVDFMLGRSMRSVFFSVMLISLAAATKMSALVVLAALLICVAIEIPMSLGVRRWAATLLGLGAASLAVPAAWLLRSQILYGNAFTLAENVLGGRPLMDNPLRVGLLEYLRSEPALEEFFVTFVGHLGWIGKTSGAQQFQNLPGSFRTVYELAMLAVAALAFTWVLRATRMAMKDEAGSPEPETLIGHWQFRAQTATGSVRAVLTGLCAAAAVFLLAFSHEVTSTTITSWLFLPAISVLFSLSAAPLLLPLLPFGRLPRGVLLGIFICAFFGAVVVWEAYSSFLEAGYTIRTLGRYFYAVLGYVVLGISAPALLALRRIAEPVALSVALILCVTDAVFFLQRIIPYFAGGS